MAFSTQKGGADKTTLTVLVASYLHYLRDYNVAVIDCNYPQRSIVEMRERDLKLALEDEHYKKMAYEQFTRINKKAYPVIESNTKEAIADAEYLIPQGDYDFIFFDLPGTMNNEHLIHSLAEMDYLIAPISADRVVLESTLNYLLVVKEHIMQPGKSNIKNLYLLWNMVDGREKSELYDVYETVIGELGFQLFRTFLPDTKRFRHEQSFNHQSLFRSTLFSPDKTLLKGSNLDVLTDEFLNLIKIRFMDKNNKQEKLDASFIISRAKSRNRPLSPYSQPLGEKSEQPEMKHGLDEKSQDEPRKRKTKGTDYEVLFFKEAEVKTRSGKVVYIRKESHDRILKIVRVIGENELSLFSYLDNVLEHHFAMFQEDISKLYKKKNTDIF
ncbi:MAG: DUF3408 domain-containing protein [Draconibacterium sp.]